MKNKHFNKKSEESDKKSLEGEKLLKIARETIKSQLKGQEYEIERETEEEFKQRKGAFVTVKINSELRGCIGFIEPIMPLWKAIQEGAKKAAFEDPRFPPLRINEYEEASIEITVLEKPKEIKAAQKEKILEEIELGKDGLIIERGYYKGLLLPQVAEEYEMSKEEFLQATCQKAGLDKNAWLDPRTKKHKFKAKIFSE